MKAGLDYRIIGSLLLVLGVLLTILLVASMYSLPKKNNEERSIGSGTLVIPLDKEGYVLRFSSRNELIDYIKRSHDTVERIRKIVYRVQGETTYTIAPIASVVTAGTAEPYIVSVENIGYYPEYYSKTNVQVEGIDEPDIVKTDGRYIYIVKNDLYVGGTYYGKYYGKPLSRIYVVKAYPPEEMDVIYTIDIENTSVQGIYVYKNLLIVIGSYSDYRIIREEGDHIVAVNTASLEYPIHTVVMVYNVSSETATLIFNRSVDGALLDSRLYNGILYLVTTMETYGLNEEIYIPRIDGKEISVQKIVSPKDTIPEKYAIIYRLYLDELVDAVDAFLIDGASRIYMSYTSLYIMQDPSYYYNIYRVLYIIVDKLSDEIGREAFKDKINDLITLLGNDSIPLPMRLEEIIDEIEDLEINSLWGNATETPEEIVVTTTTAAVITVPMNWTGTGINESEAPETITIPISIYTPQHTILYLRGLSYEEYTVIHRFSINGIDLGYAGKVKIPGRIMDSFSYSESNGYFYIATHTWVNDSNNIYVVNITSMEIVGKLENIEPGMDIYAARFMGSRAYLITYRRRDPLVVIDLSNPFKPVVLGKLLMPGYSEYLHPLGDNILLGIGYAGDEWSLKIETYNVSDPENPEIISTITINGPAYTPVMSDYHAFTIDPRHKYIIIPVDSGYDSATGIYVISYSVDGELELKGVVSLEKPIRSLYIEDTIYGVGGYHVVAVNALTLDVIKIIEYTG